MLPDAVRDKVQVFFDRPDVQARVAAVKTTLANEETKRRIVDELYDMLPRPVRWVLTKEAFEPYVREYIFREESEQRSQTNKPESTP